MFNKVSIVNKIEMVENKVDILLARIESDSMFGCCDCKKRESEFCKEMKGYIEEKMNQFEKDIVTKLTSIDESLICFKDIIQGYKTDIVSNLEIISEHISNNPYDQNAPVLTKIHEVIEAIKKDQTTQHLATHSKISESINILNTVNKQIENQTKHTKDQDKKLDVLFYENEIIKHQLLIEEEIRKYNDDINNIKDKINRKILEIDNILYDQVNML